MSPNLTPETEMAKRRKIDDGKELPEHSTINAAVAADDRPARDPLTLTLSPPRDESPPRRTLTLTAEHQMFPINNTNNGGGYRPPLYYIDPHHPIMPTVMTVPAADDIIHPIPSSTAAAAGIGLVTQQRRVRRNPSRAPREGKSDTISPPFPWSTNRRATVFGLQELMSREIFSISGDVQCKRCERQYKMELNLQEKFLEVARFVAQHKSTMHHRAPDIWRNPSLPQCHFCLQENSAKPVISPKKRMINWLFLLLGQMLGCCTLDQLKYFCKHTKNHRTGAKDRVLFLAYLGMCKQLDPDGPFDI